MTDKKKSAFSSAIDAALFAPLDQQLDELRTIQLVDPAFGPELFSHLMRSAVECYCLTLIQAEKKGWSRDRRGETFEHLFGVLPDRFATEMKRLDSMPEKVDAMLEAGASLRETILKAPRT